MFCAIVNQCVCVCEPPVKLDTHTFAPTGQSAVAGKCIGDANDVYNMGTTRAFRETPIFFVVATN